MSATTPTTPESIFGKGRYSPLFQAQRVVLDFLKWRFSELPAGSYRFDPDSDGDEQSKSEIFLAADMPLNVEKVGARPAITVLRAAAAGQGVGLGDLGYRDLATGATVRMDIYPTTITINVLSRVHVEAEGLAWFVVEQIGAFREEIVRSEPVILYLGSRPMISSPSPAGPLIDVTDPSWILIVVAFPVYLHHGVTQQPLNRPIIRGVTLNATTATPAQPVEPIVPLQGTAVAQPARRRRDEQAAVAANLPQEGVSEAQSTEPLTVEIQTR